MRNASLDGAGLLQREGWRFHPHIRGQIANLRTGSSGHGRRPAPAHTVRDCGAMAIEAVLFDIGGVLECTPRTGWEQRWATELGLSIEEVERRLAPVGRPGALG